MCAGVLATQYFTGCEIGDIILRISEYDRCSVWEGENVGLDKPMRGFTYILWLLEGRCLRRSVVVRRLLLDQAPIMRYYARLARQHPVAQNKDRE